MRKVYVGYRMEGAGAISVKVSKLWDGLTEDLSVRLDLWNHSPSGFEWGYSGSGPAQLALAILADATGDDTYARRRHRAFKREVITELPWDQWYIAKEQILKWAEEHPLPEGECSHPLAKAEEVELMDQEIVSGTLSLCCGVLCSYQAWYQDGCYSAYAVCSRCGAATEF